MAKKNNKSMKNKAFTGLIGLFFILALVFISPIISAGLTKSFINTGDYGKIEINDGAIKQAEYVLLSYDDSVLNAWAEGTVTTYEDRILFKGVEFENLQGSLISLNNVNFYIQEDESYDINIPVYQEVCSDIDNATFKGKECNEEVIRYDKHKETNKVWKPYDYKIKPAGTYIWRLEANKKQVNQKVDFILKLTDDIKTEEWAWWNSSWGYKQDVNIWGGDSLMSNFTVYVNVTYNSLMLVNFKDLRFVNGSCSGVQTTELNYEFDSIRNSSSVGVWIKIPNLQTGINKICMYYNNPTATNGQNHLNAWDSYYKGVYHMSEETGVNIIDSTGNGNGTYLNVPIPSWVNGTFGSALYFSGSTTVINFSGNNKVHFTTAPFTFEVWTNTTTTGTQGILSYSKNAEFSMYISAPTNTLRFGKLASDEIDSLLIPTQNKWNYTSISFNSTNLSIYVDKNKRITAYSSIGASATSLLAGHSLGNSFIGRLDEIRISNVSRSNDWLIRSYNNINMSMFGFGSLTDNYGVTINNLTYNSNVIEGNVESFILNITYDGIISSAYLNYNGTDYLAQVTASGLDEIISASVTIPFVTSDINKTFYWKLNLQGVGTDTTGLLNQTVRNIAIDDCTANSVLLYNFTVFDQDSIIKINTTLNFNMLISSFGTTNNFLTYNHSYSSNIFKKVCLNINLTSSPFRVDITADYQNSSGYVKQFYLVDNGTISNGTIPNNINLYDLLAERSTSFLYIFHDYSGLAIPNAIVHVYRQYIGEGIYREVENARLDNNGQAIIHLVEESVNYYYTVTLDNQLLFTSAIEPAKCISTPCSITQAQEGSDINFPIGWDISDGTSFSQPLIDRNARTVTLSFTSSGVANITYQLIAFSTGEPVLINQSNLLGQTGTVVFPIPFVYGNQTFAVDIYNGGQWFKTFYIDLTPNGRDYFGGFGAILGFLLLVSLIMMAVSEGTLTAVVIVISIILITLIKLVDMTWLAIGSIIAVAGVLIWKAMSKRGGG